MSLVQNVWVSKCLDLYAVAQCLGGIMSGWQNVLVSKCLGARISCSHNVWVSKRGVSKCPGVEMSGAEMSENPLGRGLSVSMVSAHHQGAPVGGGQQQVRPGGGGKDSRV